MEYSLNPYKCLTVELIDSIHIHHTVSSLRRALEMSPWIEKVDETEYVPTLYYRKGSKDPNENDWTVHALCKDLHRWELKKHIDDTPCPEPDPEPIKYQSSIDWDGFTGKISEYPLITYKDGGILIFDGYIGSDKCGNNTVGLILTMDKDSYDGCKDTLKLRYLNFEYTNLESNVLHFLLPFRVPGQEIPVELEWNKDHIQHYTICLTQESHLLR